MTRVSGKLGKNRMLGEDVEEKRKEKGRQEIRGRYRRGEEKVKKDGERKVWKNKGGGSIDREARRRLWLSFGDEVEMGEVK